MWPSESLLRVLIIVTMSLIYFLRRAQWEDQLRSLIKLHARHKQSMRVHATLWLLLSICFFLVLRTVRVRLMQIHERREINLEVMQLYLNMQQTEPQPMPGMDGAKWDELIQKYTQLKRESNSGEANSNGIEQPNSIPPADSD